MLVAKRLAVLFLGFSIAGCTPEASGGGGVDNVGGESDAETPAGDAALNDAGPVADAGLIDAGAPAGDAARPDVAVDVSVPMDAMPPAAFELTSAAFAEGEVIPLRHECGRPAIEGPGDNITPPLEWTPGPPETMSYAIVMRDIDARRLVHWVLYDIPASTRAVAENVPGGYEPAFPAGAKQAELQMSGYFGYLGPCSPASVNTYQITVYALATETLPRVDSTTTENVLAAALEAAAIASATLSGES